MMKKFMCFFLISILLCCQVSYATVSIPIEAFEKIEKNEPSEPTKEVLVTNNGLVSRGFNPVEKSVDGINYVTLKGSIPVQHSKVGNRYVYLSGDPFGGTWPPQRIRDMASDGPMYVYDENLEYITEIDYGMAKIQVLYETPDYSRLYFTVYPNPGSEVVRRSYYTTDGENWIECEEIPQDVLDFNKSGSFFGPKHNDRVTYPYKNHKGIRTYYLIEKQNEMCTLIFKTNGIEHYEVVGEADDFSSITYDLVDAVLSSTFTSDGIYFYTLPFEATSWNVNGYFYFETYDSYYRLPESYFNHTYVTFGDKLLAFEETPKMDSGRILVPMRFLFEQMGGEVGWNPTLRIASFITKQNTVDFPIGSKTAIVNGVAEEMDIAAKIINNKTYVPLRFLSESLGYNVDWDADTRTAHITTD